METETIFSKKSFFAFGFVLGGLSAINLIGALIFYKFYY